MIPPLIECMIIFRGLVATNFLLSQAGAQVSINQSPDYNHPQTGGSPVYYSSRCSVSVSVSELGEGTHSFMGKIYPGVRGGQNLVNAIEPTKTVSLCESLLFILINFFIFKVELLASNCITFSTNNVTHKSKFLQT